MSTPSPVYRIYLDDSGNGTFTVENETDGSRYLDMLPHEIADFFYALQEQEND